jgi:hypothetical protein
MCANRTAHPRGPGVAPPSGPPPLSCAHCPTRSAHWPSSGTARLPSTAAHGHADAWARAADKRRVDKPRRSRRDPRPRGATLRLTRPARAPAIVVSVRVTPPLAQRLVLVAPALRRSPNPRTNRSVPPAWHAVEPLLHAPEAVGDCLLATVARSPDRACRRKDRTCPGRVPGLPGAVPGFAQGRGAAARRLAFQQERLEAADEPINEAQQPRKHHSAEPDSPNNTSAGKAASRSSRGSGPIRS